jgi:hypothetical protein
MYFIVTLILYKNQIYCIEILIIEFEMIWPNVYIRVKEELQTSTLWYNKQYLSLIKRKDREGTPTDRDKLNDVWNGS